MGIDILWLILTGAAAGVLAGMGIGGGAVLIPALTIFFGQSQHAAQNINLIYFVPTAAFALFVHGRNGQIEKKGLAVIIVGGIVGAAAGSIIALNLQGEFLRQVFAVFLLVMGVLEIWKGRKKVPIKS